MDIINGTVCSPIGIGDILIIKHYSILKNIKINTFYFKQIHLNYRLNGLIYFKFIKNLINKLFDNCKIILLSLTDKRELINTLTLYQNSKIYDLYNLYKFKFKYRNYIFDKPYIIIHTKCRFDKLTINLFNNELHIIDNYFSNLKTNYNIVLFGEKNAENNIETKSLGIISIYSILIKMNKNNNVIDLTSDIVSSNNDINNFENDLHIINGAILNITFGHGGPFVISKSFSNNTVGYIGKLNYNYPNSNDIDKNKIMLCNNLNDFFNEINKITNNISSLIETVLLPEIKENNNILYLLNHKTLTNFELPILINKGYGVLINKIYKSLDIYNSVTNSDENFYYDNFLSLDISTINLLNKIDWYDNNQLLDNNIINILNDKFKFIFITLLTGRILLKQLITSFKGKIFYRFFGREGILTYYNILPLKSNNIKYIFSYNECLIFEKKFFNSDNSYIVPLGLDNKFITNNINTYYPKNNDIIFICSKINKCLYYTNIYNEFLNNFSKYNYKILGKNNITTNENIINNLSDDDYYKKIRESKLMYYHGIEPRHLHYHPIEAIIIGIPIIFHSESLLTSYLFNSPGKCNTITEVREKIDRIINNDYIFISDIINEQNKSIELFTQKNNKNIFDNVLF